MAIKLKHGHTYVTRSGVKRKVSHSPNWSLGKTYPFECKSFNHDGITEAHTITGKYIAGNRKPHEWDFIAEAK